MCVRARTGMHANVHVHALESSERVSQEVYLLVSYPEGYPA